MARSNENLRDPETLRDYWRERQAEALDRRDAGIEYSAQRKTRIIVALTLLSWTIIALVVLGLRALVAA